MTKTSKTEEERLEKTAWLLNPERTRENIILYGLILLLVVAITILLV